MTIFEAITIMLQFGTLVAIVIFGILGLIDDKPSSKKNKKK